MYNRRRQRCFGLNSDTSGGEAIGKSKKEKMASPVKLASTIDHPMGIDLAISRGVF